MLVSHLQETINYNSILGIPALVYISLTYLTFFGGNLSVICQILLSVQQNRSS